MKRLQVIPEAKAEAADAVEWLEQARPGLGQEFRVALRALIMRLQPTEQHAVLEECGGYQVRSALLRRFKYRVIFLDLPDEVRVLAVMHTARRPSYWRGRI